MKDLRDRVALVTGGSRGIGAGVAIALARAGAHVAVNYRERADAANAICGEIIGTGRKAIAIQADVSVSADVTRMVAEIEAHLGGIDILVNNAGIAHPRKLEDITEAEWDEVLTVNLKSVFLVTQAVVGGMRQRRWGRMINLSSVAAQTGGAVGAHSRHVQGGDHRSDALLRCIAHSRRNHRERHCSRADRDRYGDQQPQREPESYSDGALWLGGGHCTVAVMLAMNDYMTGRLFRQRRMVYELVPPLCPLVAVQFDRCRAYVGY